MTKYLKENLANLITFSGIVSAMGGFANALINPEKLWLTLLLDSYTGLTDIIDGRIADWFKIKTTFGSFLDKLRDRIFIWLNLFIIIFYNRWKLKNLTHILVLGGLILLFEVLILLAWCFGMATVYLGGKEISLDSNKSGRAKTACAFITILFWVILLTAEKYFDYPTINKFTISITTIFLALVLGLAALSFKGYYERYFKPEKQK